jgi:predicted secreted protein
MTPSASSISKQTGLFLKLPCGEFTYLFSEEIRSRAINKDEYRKTEIKRSLNSLPITGLDFLARVLDGSRNHDFS